MLLILIEDRIMSKEKETEEGPGEPLRMERDSVDDLPAIESKKEVTEEAPGELPRMKSDHVNQPPASLFDSWS